MVEFVSMSSGKNIRSILLAVCTTLFLCSCKPSEREHELNVAAAASLSQVFQALAQDYERQTGTRVIPSFSATGQLAQQIRNGAPFDVFAAADSQHIDDLIADGYLVGQTRVTYALGRLILVKPAGSTPELETIGDLTHPQIRRIAIGNPNHAPYGIAAKEALMAIGLWEVVEPKIIYGETVKQAAIMVETGNADAGLIALSVLDPRIEVVEHIPDDFHHPIQHVAAVATAARDGSLARSFLDYLHSAEAEAILAESGFVIP
jgi:molybdate transport system substrate-binding protein